MKWGHQYGQSMPQPTWLSKRETGPHAQDETVMDFPALGLTMPPAHALTSIPQSLVNKAVLCQQGTCYLN